MEPELPGPSCNIVFSRELFLKGGRHIPGTSVTVAGSMFFLMRVSQQRRCSLPVRLINRLSEGELLQGRCLFSGGGCGGLRLA